MGSCTKTLIKPNCCCCFCGGVVIFVVATVWYHYWKKGHYKDELCPKISSLQVFIISAEFVSSSSYLCSIFSIQGLQVLILAVGKVFSPGEFTSHIVSARYKPKAWILTWSHKKLLPYWSNPWKQKEPSSNICFTKK